MVLREVREGSWRWRQWEEDLPRVGNIASLGGKQELKVRKEGLERVEGLWLNEIDPTQ